jgi:hypothetical protein
MNKFRPFCFSKIPMGILRPGALALGCFLGSLHAGELKLETSTRVVPVLDRLEGTVRFLGVPVDIKRLKDSVLFSLDDGAGLVPCVIGLGSATFTLENLLLVEGVSERRQDGWMVRVKKIEALAPPAVDLPMATVAQILGLEKAPRQPHPLVTLVGLYEGPEGTEKEDLNFYFLRDATGKIRVTGKFIDGINFSSRFNGLPIKVVGRLRGTEFEALHVLSTRDIDSPSAIRYRVLNEIFNERKIEFQKVR